MSDTAHVDTFARDNLPPRERWPAFLFTRPELQYPERLNCCARLLDRWIEEGRGDARCLISPAETLTYAEVVTLAHPDYPQHSEITYSVTYTRGHGDKPEGILPPGGSVKVKEGMAFSVNRTGQS